MMIDMNGILNILDKMEYCYKKELERDDLSEEDINILKIKKQTVRDVSSKIYSYYLKVT